MSPTSGYDWGPTETNEKGKTAMPVLTIELPDDVYLQICEAAAQQGISVEAYVLMIVIEAVKRLPSDEPPAAPLDSAKESTGQL